MDVLVSWIVLGIWIQFHFMQVFKEAATFRGKMKTMCRSLIAQYYSDDISPRGTNGENQFHAQSIVCDQIEDLLGPSCQFHLGKSENVSLL